MKYLESSEGVMEEIEKRFNDEFSPWGIRIPKEDVTNCRRGKVIEAGWVIWYLFGSVANSDR